MDRLFGEVLKKTLLHMTHAELGDREDLAPAEQDGAVTSDLRRTGEHAPITWDLIRMVEHSPELKTLLQEAIRKAAELNPDRRTNPVHSLESYYAFLDRSALALPWAIIPSEEYSDLYDRIDQSMGCFYFVCDQPLDALEGKGYYHNSLMYHEPFRSWLVKFTAEYGEFLNTEDSWCEEYYLRAKEDSRFQLNGDLYESPENWRTFNEFFARRLRDPAERPIDAPEDDRVVVSPADAVAQSTWRIDENHRVIPEEPGQNRGIPIKTGTLTAVPALLGGSSYARAFAGGRLTHTLLDVNDYHRYHFPVSGTVREVLIIPGDDAPGGVITWDPEAGRYKEYGSEEIGWQSIETRGVVILEMDAGGLAAVVPVGMCEVASVNFEAAVKPGARMRKGDPLGYFLFGGSDVIMIFSREAGFAMTAEGGKHLNMGREYGRLKTGSAGISETETDDE